MLNRIFHVDRGRSAGFGTFACWDNSRQGRADKALSSTACSLAAVKVYGAGQQESEGSHYQDAVLCTQEILLSAQGSGGSRVNNIVQFGGAGVLKVQHNTTFKTILRRCFALLVAFALASGIITTFRLLLIKLLLPAPQACANLCVSEVLCTLQIVVCDRVKEGMAYSHSANCERCRWLPP